MYEALGSLAFQRRWWILASSLVFVVLSGVWGTGVYSALTKGGFEASGSESQEAERLVGEVLGRQQADVIVLYTADEWTVDDPRFQAAVEKSLSGLPDEHVAQALSFWDFPADELVSADRHSTYAAVSLEGADMDARDAAFTEVKDDFAVPGLTVELGGVAAVNHDLDTQVGLDIIRAELISMPLLLVLLILVFGSFFAAGAPLVIGVVAILGSFTVLHVFSLFTDVSIFAVNVVTMLGLGLAIDYSLFIVSRFREELGRGLDVESALRRTLATAGRTVAFSGLVVGLSLSSLLFFPQVYLKSMGMGGIAAVLVAMIAAMTVLPAVLAVMGHRVDKWRIRLPWRRSASLGRPEERGAWYRLAGSVMRRPVVYLVVIVIALITLGLPFRDVAFGTVDYRVLPENTENRVVAEALEDHFPGGASASIPVFVSGADQADVEGYRAELAGLEGVTDARITDADGDAAHIFVVHEADESSKQAQELVLKIRDHEAPAGADVFVGGATANLIDQLDAMKDILPWVVLFIVLVTFVVLFFAFGSIVLPLKAILINMLSLTASFGAIVWIFQDGNLSGLLGFTATGAIDPNQPVLMFAIAFGLSMDYEVFLLSRIREEWDRTGDNTVAVASGIQRSGFVITSAAVMLAVVIGAFSTSSITMIKMIGVGLLIAILMDAFVVRALLVPAAMRLMGGLNWWAPKSLTLFWQRYGRRIPTQPVPEIRLEPQPEKKLV